MEDECIAVWQNERLRNVSLHPDVIRQRLELPGSIDRPTVTIRFTFSVLKAVRIAWNVPGDRLKVVPRVAYTVG